MQEDGEDGAAGEDEAADEEEAAGEVAIAAAGDVGLPLVASVEIREHCGQFS